MHRARVRILFYKLKDLFMIDSIGFAYRVPMLLRHLTCFLAVAEHRSLPEPRRRCMFRSRHFHNRSASLKRCWACCYLTARAADPFDRFRRGLAHLCPPGATGAGRGQTSPAGGRRPARGTLRVAMTPTFTTYFMGPLVAALSALSEHHADDA